MVVKLCYKIQSVPSLMEKAMKLHSEDSMVHCTPKPPSYGLSINSHSLNSTLFPFLLTIFLNSCFNG